MEWIRKIGSWLVANKGKFFLLLVSIFVFGFLLFPFGDLGDLVSVQVAKLTGNQVYLRFDDMHMSLFPDTGMAFDEVTVETPFLAGLKAQQVVFTPSLSSLISQKPAGSVMARGFLKGDLEVSLKPGSKSDNGVERQKIQITAQHLNLNELHDLLQLPVVVKGNLQMSSQAQVDLSFQEQPDADLSLKVDRFEMPSGNVQTMMGPLTLPDLKLARLELKGRLSAGKFLIEEGLIGQDSDELHGRIKGRLDLQIRNNGGALTPIPGAYDLEIELTAKKSFQEKANLFLNFIDAYKTPTNEGALYKFKISASNPQVPPTINSLR